MDQDAHDIVHLVVRIGHTGHAQKTFAPMRHNDISNYSILEPELTKGQ